MINSDHGSTLRGSKNGDVVKISEHAPNVTSCDIGGDCLHDLNNATKGLFYATFGDVIKIIYISRQDLGIKERQKIPGYLQ